MEKVFFLFFIFNSLRTLEQKVMKMSKNELKIICICSTVLCNLKLITQKLI